MKLTANNSVPALLLFVLASGTLLAAGMWITAERQRQQPLPRFARLGKFRFIERSERPVTQGDIAGKIVVADFFFASCSAECQVLGRRMREVQELTSGMDDVMLLSFTVDPRSDTPQVLTRRANELSASSNRWLFLTGEKTNLYPFIQQHFLLAAGEDDASAFGGFIHSSRIALVDRHGVVRGYYDGLAALTSHRIFRDIQKLREEQQRDSTTQTTEN